MRTGLCTISNKEWDPESVVDLAASVGFDAVEVWGGEHVNGGDPSRCRAVAAACEDAGVAVAVYGSYLRPGTASYDEEWESTLEAAAALDADLVRVWPGDQNYGEHEESHWAQTVSDLEHLAPRAADRGLEVTIEKHVGTLSWRDEGAARLVEAVDAPNCGLNWQPTFVDDAAAVVESAERLAPLTNNVHLQSVPEPCDVRTTDVSRSLLADGYFDLGAVIAPFVDRDLPGAVEVEFVTPDLDYETAVTRDHEYLAAALEGR
jgi:sugar phosphate isomerase/epimerase